MSMSMTIDLEDLRKNREASLAFVGLLRTLLLGTATADVARPVVDVERRRRRRVSKTMTWDAFKETLSPQTVGFLDLVREAGTISLPVVAERMGLLPKALGGLTGAMQRKAGNRGVTVPIQVGIDAAGDRTWTWVGASGAATASEAAEAPEGTPDAEGASADSAAA